jgi:hypothetical protein
MLLAVLLKEEIMKSLNYLEIIISNERMHSFFNLQHHFEFGIK